MLSQRELKLLAQIEAYLHADEPRLAHVLSKGSRWALLTRPEPAVLRGLLLVALTMLVGAALMVAGAFDRNVLALAAGMLTAIVLPLPVWLIATRWVATGSRAGQTT